MGNKQQKKPHKPSGKLGRRARKRQEENGKAQRMPVKASAALDGKAQRRQASELRRQKARSAEFELRRRPGAPTVVGLLPLSEAVNCGSLFSSIVAACTSSEEMLDEASTSGQVSCNVQLPGVRRMKWTLLPTLKKSMEALAVVEFLAAAELIILVADGDENAPPIDGVGLRNLQMLRSIGLPSVVCAIQGIREKTVKGLSAAKKRVTQVLTDELSSGVKAFVIGGRSECESMLHHLQPQKMTIPAWRRSRPSLFVQSASFNENELHLEGYIRQQTLSANQVVTISGVGDYLIRQIRSAIPAPTVGLQVNSRADSAMETVLAVPDPDNQHPIVQENDVPDDIEDEDLIEIPDSLPMVSKRVPKGTSDYQAAWIVEDENYLTTDSEMEALDEELNELQLEEMDDLDMDSRSVGMATSVAPSEVDSEDFVWDDAAERMAVEDLREREEDERNFPDEVEVPIDVPGRTRFAAYRGLKSFRTSPWDIREGLPRDYARVYAFESFRNACKRFRAEKEGVEKGHYVCLVLESVEKEAGETVMERVQAASTGEAAPLVVYGLLKHETKVSVVNFRVRKCPTYEEPVSNKEEFMFMTGFRTFSARPLFSTDDPRCDKHKMEKFLAGEGTGFATVYAQVGFPPLPLLAFKMRNGHPELAFSGSLHSCDPDRVVLKKIILTGKPGAVKKKTCVVVGMFNDPEDSRWFKPLELWTKYGRSGYIKESLGTHGAYKAYFDGSVQQRDTICMSLYKRVFPVWPKVEDNSMVEGLG